MIAEPVPEWFALAECAGCDPALFYPPRGTATKDAKAVCRRCPVVAECRVHALTRGERFGIWGGLSERERRFLRRDERANA